MTEEEIKIENVSQEELNSLEKEEGKEEEYEEIKENKINKNILRTFISLFSFIYMFLLFTGKLINNL
jgi:hypothetical protein